VIVESEERGLNIGSAGNTENPCLLALRAKGYEILFEFTESASGYRSDVLARKDGRQFYASNAAELLGLVAMWEVRGDDWRTKPGEADVYDECYPNSRTYDSAGNLIEVGGEPVA
jgi:hypothetical protein